MYCREIAITNLADAKRFVNMTGKYSDMHIYLYSNNYKMDAHSIMGVISLDMSQPIQLEVEDSEIPEEFMLDLEPFIATHGA